MEELEKKEPLTESMSRAFLRIVQSGETEIIKSYLKHIHPKMTKEHRDRFEDVDFMRFVSPKGLYFCGDESVQAIIEAYPFTESLAYLYLDLMTMSTSEERSLFKLSDLAIESLGSMRNIAFFESLALANPQLTQKIIDFYGHDGMGEGIAIDSHGTMIVNGKNSYALSYNLTHDFNGDLLKSMKIGHEHGLGYIFTPGSNKSGFFHKDRNQEDRASGINKINLLSSQLLPVFSEGVVSNPELLLHMKDLLDSSVCAQSAFERVPFWSTPDEAIKLSSCRLYEKDQRVIIGGEYGTESVNYCAAKEFTHAEAFYPDIGSTQIIFRQKDASGDCSEPLYFDDARVAYMLDNELKAGLSHPKGKFLCIADVNELAQMSMRQSSPERMSDIDDFMQSYSLFEVMVAMNANPLILNEMTGLMETRIFNDNNLYRNAQYQEIHKSNDTNRFIESVAKDRSLLSEAVDKLGSLFFKLVGREHVDIKTCINLYENGGYNNEHYSMRIVSDDCVKKIQESDFKFMENSRSCRSDPGSGVVIDIEPNLDLSIILYKKGLWPGKDGTKPLSIRDSLDRMRRMPNDDMLNRAYLCSQDIGDIAKECRSEKDWAVFFETAEKTKVSQSSLLKIIPLSQKRAIVESEFGL